MYARNHNDEKFVLVKWEMGVFGLTYWYYRLTPRYVGEKYSTNLQGILRAPTSTTYELEPVDSTVITFEQKLLAETLLQEREYYAAKDEIKPVYRSASIIDAIDETLFA